MGFSTEELVRANEQAHQDILGRCIQRTTRINNQIINGIKECNIVPNMITDTQHTFEQLYDQRAAMFLAICKLYIDNAWKFLLNPEMPIDNNTVVLGLTTPKGHIMQQYDAITYWEKFKEAGISTLSYHDDAQCVWKEEYRNDPEFENKINSILFPE